MCGETLHRIRTRRKPFLTFPYLTYEYLILNPKFADSPLASLEYPSPYLETSTAAVSTMADSFYPPRHLYYDGQVQLGSGAIFRSIDPSTAQPLADIHAASHSDIDLAIQSAQRAFHDWSKTPPVARSRILLKAVQLLRDRNDEIAKTETQDTGKPFSETSTVDVVTGADVLEFFANLVGGGGLNGETTQLREDAWVYTKKEALGVCAGIGAWNYPIQMYAGFLRRHGYGAEVGIV